MFSRPHHQRIALILQMLDGDLLRRNSCLFGGGTAIALSHSEFRESVDMDFLVSDMTCYRQLRQLASSVQGINSFVREGAGTLDRSRDIRADQYGIRTMLMVGEFPIKFEIILEARISLDAPDPSRQICGISTLSEMDMVTSKLLANSDRWNDPSVFSRDLIDLAMMGPETKVLNQAINKAKQAYGECITHDLVKAIDSMQTRPEWLERCIEALKVNTPQAAVWQMIRSLRNHLKNEPTM